MLKELKTQHRTIIQMSFQGFSNNDIAERLEMSPPSVSTILRSPLGQAYLGGLNDKAQENTLDVRKKLTALNRNALAAFENILSVNTKAPHAVQATVAKDILDRNGYKPPDKLTIDMSLVTKTDKEIDAEINALEDSINKARLQDPIKQIAEEPKEPEDSISEIPAIIKDVVPTIIEAHKEFDFSDLDSEDIPTGEDILGNIPTDIFVSKDPS